MQIRILDEIKRLTLSRVPFAIATVVEAKGSVPGKAGARMLVLADGTAIGTVGGAGLEEKVKTLAREAIETGKADVHTFHLARQKPGGLDSLCGGTVTVYVEPVKARPHLLLFGGGHVAHETAGLCDRLEYLHSVVDDRPDYASRERFPNAQDLFCRKPSEFFGGWEPARYSHLLLLGYSWEIDVEILRRALPAFEGWIGVIASASKKFQMSGMLREQGIPETKLARVHWPVGLPIGAESPEEIAVAILGEIIRDVKQAGPAGSAGG